MSESLLQQIAAGNPAAINEFVRRHSSAIWGLARRFCAGPEEAEDALQEILLEIWRIADRYDPSAGSEMTFTMTVARRRLIDRTRRRGRRPAPELLADQDVAAPEVGSSKQAELGDEVARAKAALQQLRPEQRQVLELSLAEGRTHQEIAVAVGIPLGTVKSHARRGLIRLRELLGVEPGTQPEGGAS